VVSVRGEGTCVVFKQIAGLIARRIVFNKQPGDLVEKGERVGLIKFGSRVDVVFGPEWKIAVQPGQRVSAGSSVIARRPDLADADLTEALTLVPESRELAHAEA
jgi:phosphatidylserine decarboxylase